MFNPKWLMTSTAGGVIFMYALPMPILRVPIGIVFIFLLLAGISGIIALRFLKSNELRASENDAKKLFSLGLGVVLGGVVSIVWLIPNVWYIHR